MVPIMLWKLSATGTSGSKLDTMRILLTNDDGVHAPGISVLAKAMSDAGHEVVIVAPFEDSSGAGAGVGIVYQREKIHYEPVELEGLEDIATYGIDALPALAVILARLGGFGEIPEVVVAGINLGLNTGGAVLHSGTVGAILTAGHLGLKGLAVSIEAKMSDFELLAREEDKDGLASPKRAIDPKSKEKVPFETAASIAVDVLARMKDAPEGTMLNLNVPRRPLQAIRGVRYGHLGMGGLIRGAVASMEGGLRLDVGLPRTPDPSTDIGLVTSGYASITSLGGIEEDLDPEKRTLLDVVIQECEENLAARDRGSAAVNEP